MKYLIAVIATTNGYTEICSRNLFRRVSYKDETFKYREFNLFNKKVPKDAEVTNIQVGHHSNNNNIQVGQNNNNNIQ